MISVNVASGSGNGHEHSYLKSSRWLGGIGNRLLEIDGTTRRRQTQMAPKRLPPGATRQCHKVGSTPTIRRTETRNVRRATKGTGRRRPDTLQSPRIRRCPHFHDRSDASQVVNVPARARRRSQVVAKPATKATRTERASRIEVNRCFEPDEAEATYANPRSGLELED